MTPLRPLHRFLSQTLFSSAPPLPHKSHIQPSCPSQLLSALCKWQVLELAYLHPEEDHKSVWLKRMLDSFTNLKLVFCMNLALRILEGLVLCACMYAAETWLVTKEMCQELNAFFEKPEASRGVPCEAENTGVVWPLAENLNQFFEVYILPAERKACQVIPNYLLDKCISTYAVRASLLVWS